LRHTCLDLMRPLLQEYESYRRGLLRAYDFFPSFVEVLPDDVARI